MNLNSNRPRENNSNNIKNICKAWILVFLAYFHKKRMKKKRKRDNEISCLERCYDKILGTRKYREQRHINFTLGQP